MAEERVIWQPLPGSQTLAMSCPANIILYTGGRGAGKTDCQLLRFRARVGQGYGRHWRGVIFDREYKNLDDLVSKSQRWFPEFYDGCRFINSKSDYKWVWKTGEELLFRTIKKESDYWNYHGQEFCVSSDSLISVLNKGDIEIQELLVGDMILTNEGYKRVNKVYSPTLSECNKVLVYDENNKFIGEQIQSVDHRLLTNDSQPFSKIPDLYQNDLQYLYISDLLSEVLKFHLYGHQASKVFFDQQKQYPLFQDNLSLLICLIDTFGQYVLFLIQNNNLQENLVLDALISAYFCSDFFLFEDSNEQMLRRLIFLLLNTFQQVYPLSFQNHNLKSTVLSSHLKNKFLFEPNLEDGGSFFLRLRRSNLKVLQQKQLHHLSDKERPLHHPRYTRFHHRLAILRSSSIKYDAQYALNKINLKNLLMYLWQLKELHRQVFYFVLGNDQPLNVKLDQGITTDYQSHYYAYYGLYDELPRSLLNIALDIVRQPVDALKYIHDNHNTDELVKTDNYNRMSSHVTYIHPYSLQKRGVAVPFQAGKSLVFSCGFHNTIDIEVDDCNNYITTSTGLTNSNCYIGWNELTKYPDLKLFDAMASCNRSSFRPEDFPYWIDGDIYNKTGNIKFVHSKHKKAVVQYLPEIPLETFATCNPYGPGHNAIKKRFINVAPMGKIHKTVVNVFNPKTQKREDITKTQVHIFGSYMENKYLSPEYIVSLETITDPNKRKAWLMGSWDVVSGGMFDDVWDRVHHVVTPFNIPKSWRIDRSFDWGSSKPFSVGWWAESDGSDIKLPDGTVRHTIRGDVFRIYEWYGCVEGAANEGLRMLGEDIAKGIIERELKWEIYDRVHPGPADNSIFDVENGNSIAASMRKSVRINNIEYAGVEWIRSDKSPGSRIAGWEKMRLYLKQAAPQYRDYEIRNGLRVPVLSSMEPREQPGMFAFDRCVDFISQIPTLPRDEKNPDEVDTFCEDHIADEARYKLLSIGVGAKSGKTTGVQ